MRRRIFKSSTPVEMITNGASDKSTDTSPTPFSRTDSAVYTYPVFGMELTKIIKADQSYRSKAQNIEQSAVDFSVCREEDVADIPILVLNCLAYLSQYALESEGIFRISAGQLAVETLKQRILQSEFNCKSAMAEHLMDPCMVKHAWSQAGVMRHYQVLS